jgi:hypothetical protein
VTTAIRPFAPLPADLHDLGEDDDLTHPFWD